MFEWKNQTALPGFEPGTHRFRSAVLYQLSYGVVVNPDRTERPFYSFIQLVEHRWSKAMDPWFESWWCSLIFSLEHLPLQPLKKNWFLQITWTLIRYKCMCSMQSGNLAQSADCAATAPATTCTCVHWRDNFKENRENCHDFIVLYCVRNWEGISVIENLVRHNNRSFRANKLVIVSPNYKQENE